MAYKYKPLEASSRENFIIFLHRFRAPTFEVAITLKLLNVLNSDKYTPYHPHKSFKYGLLSTILSFPSEINSRNSTFSSICFLDHSLPTQIYPLVFLSKYRM